TSASSPPRKFTNTGSVARGIVTQVTWRSSPAAPAATTVPGGSARRRVSWTVIGGMGRIPRALIAVRIQGKHEDAKTRRPDVVLGLGPYNALVSLRLCGFVLNLNSYWALNANEHIYCIKRRPILLLWRG